jgi:hypothetical protein
MSRRSSSIGEEIDAPLFPHDVPPDAPSRRKSGYGATNLLDGAGRSHVRSSHGNAIPAGSSE